MTFEEWWKICKDDVECSRIDARFIWKEACLVARKAEREECAMISEYGDLQIGCTAIEAETIVRKTRNCIADAIRKRGMK